MSSVTIPYQLSVEPTGTHMLLVAAVSNGATVLDVGCSTGYLGQWLVAHKSAKVWGIEPVEEAAAIAEQQNYEAVYRGSIETVLAAGDLNTRTFDYILLGDILEHVVDPVGVLRQLSLHVNPGGACIISVPNVAHYSVRLKLLCGSWDMTETGILDRTHLHFYTKKTAAAMITAAGLTVRQSTPRGDVDRWTGRIGLKKLGTFLLRRFPGWWAVQNVFIAVKS